MYMYIQFIPSYNDSSLVTCTLCFHISPCKLLRSHSYTMYILPSSEFALGSILIFTFRALCWPFRLERGRRIRWAQVSMWTSCQSMWVSYLVLWNIYSMASRNDGGKPWRKVSHRQISRSTLSSWRLAFPYLLVILCSNACCKVPVHTYRILLFLHQYGHGIVFAKKLWPIREMAFGDRRINLIHTTMHAIYKLPSWLPYAHATTDCVILSHIRQKNMLLIFNMGLLHMYIPWA